MRKARTARLPAELWDLPPRVARPRTAQADDYPSRTITFLCPFPAGGGTDILTRLLAQELQDKLGKPVIVENRVGAGTQIAANATAQDRSPTATRCSLRRSPRWRSGRTCSSRCPTTR